MRRLLLFAKRPRPGKVKTRLSPPLDPTQALALYRAFLDDGLRLLRDCASDYRSEVWWDGPLDDPALAGLNRRSLLERDQGEGGLGERLTRAFGEHDCPAVVIGADSPTLGRGSIDRAFGTLSEARPVALQPALDGGYVLLGLWRPRAEIFASIPWSGPAVCEATLERASRLGLRVELLPPGYDVDDAEDLRRLEADLAEPAVAARAPATWRALRLLF